MFACRRKRHTKAPEFPVHRPQKSLAAGHQQRIDCRCRNYQIRLDVSIRLRTRCRAGHLRRTKKPPRSEQAGNAAAMNQTSRKMRRMCRCETSEDTGVQSHKPFRVSHGQPLLPRGQARKAPAPYLRDPHQRSRLTLKGWHLRPNNSRRLDIFRVMSNRGSIMQKVSAQTTTRANRNRTVLGRLFRPARWAGRLLIF